MDYKKLVKDYRNRLVLEGLLNATIYGLTTAFTAVLIFAIFAFLFRIKALWIGAIIGGGLFAIVTFVTYFWFFRPDDKEIASRMDALGLEERVITMNQLQNDDSFIAKLQREDALKAINTVTAKLIKITVGLPLLIALCCTFVLSSGVMTVTALSQSGVITPPFTPIVPDPEEEVWVDVEYDIMMGDGFIEGEMFQRVKKGENCEPVLAVEALDYVFYMWSDGSDSPYRCDAVEKDTKFLAIFMPVEEGDGMGMSGGSGEDGMEADSDKDGPPGDGNGDGPSGPSDPDAPPSGGVGGKYEPANQVYDGETYYGGEVYKQALQEVIERLSTDETKTQAEKDFIMNYFKAIEK